MHLCINNNILQGYNEKLSSARTVFAIVYELNSIIIRH